MATRTCGTCDHWGRAQPYIWGHCLFELPMCYDDPEFPHHPQTRPDDDAAECACYKEAPDGK